MLRSLQYGNFHVRRTSSFEGIANILYNSHVDQLLFTTVMPGPNLSLKPWALCKGLIRAVWRPAIWKMDTDPGLRVVFLRKSLRSCLLSLIIVYQPSHVSYSNFAPFGRFCAGFPLEPIERTTEKLKEQLLHYRVDHVCVLIEQFLYAIKQLAGSAETPIDWKAIASAKPAASVPSETLRWSYWCWGRIQLAYYFGQYEIAYSLLGPYARLSAIDTAYFTTSIRVFFTGLTACALFRKTRKWKYLKQAKQATKEMKVIMSTRGLNNLHRYLIMQADLLTCTNGALVDIKKAFDKSISTAGKAGFTQDAALANELAGEFFLKKGDDFWPHQYFSRAMELYREWGASAKIEQLKASRTFYFDSSRLGRMKRGGSTSSALHWVSGEDSEIHKAINFDMLGKRTSANDLSIILDSQWSREGHTSATWSETSHSQLSSSSASPVKAKPLRSILRAPEATVDTTNHGFEQLHCAQGCIIASDSKTAEKKSGLAKRKEFLVTFAANKQSEVIDA